jgi:hypothetical protein
MNFVNQFILSSLPKNEEYQWFRTLVENQWFRTLVENHQNDLKPDNMLVREGLFISKTASGSVSTLKFRARESFKNVIFLFGKGIWKIRDMINAILEWKVQITDEDRGTLYSYLQHLCRGDYNNTYRGIVADRTGFICAECEKESIRNIMAVKWTDRGAEDYIQNFISKKNQWLSLFNDLCNVNQVLPAVYKNSSSAFLGSGKYGRCFTVKKKDSNHFFVLKCVL